MIEDYYDKPTVKVNFARYKKSRSGDGSYRRYTVNYATRIERPKSYMRNP